MAWRQDHGTETVMSAHSFTVGAHLFLGPRFLSPMAMGAERRSLALVTATKRRTVSVQTCFTVYGHDCFLLLEL